MAGHSHWAGIKHKKALVDAKRSKLWSKLSKAITVAAKMGGGDPDANPRLRTAVLDAKAVSMPKDNIDRAIKKGTGELAGDDVVEALYEGYAPGGVAVMCEIMSDNFNRTAGEIRKLFDKYDGKLGTTNCVAYLFARKGLFFIPADKVDEERLTEVALEAGADDVERVDDQYEVTCSPEVFADVEGAFERAGVPVESKELTRIPTSTVDVTDTETAKKILKLMEALDDHDDVQNVSANFNIPEEAMAALGDG